MTFQENRIGDFLAIFNASKNQIRHFEGCQHLELLQDYTQPNVMITYSHWQNEKALENYRQSQLFATTWAATKALFAEKPIAFSSRKVQEVP